MNRYDMIYYVEAHYCNPNGDPDMDNMPRVDPHSGRGLMTPQALKRKIRDYLPYVRWAVDAGHVCLPQTIWSGGTPPTDKEYDIYVKSLHNLKLQDRLAILKDRAENKGRDRVERLAARYYDVRAFGAVLTSGRAGSRRRGDEDEMEGVGGNEDNIQVVGPLQVSYGYSIHPVNVLRVGLTSTVTRDDLSKEVKAKFSIKDVDEVASVEQLQEIQRYLIETSPSTQRTMGRAYIIDHGIYKFTISVDPFRAEALGFDEYDLALFVRTLVDWPNQHKTTSKFGMRHKKLFVFKHNSQYGNMPIWELEQLVDEDSFTVSSAKLPDTIQLIDL